MKKIMTILTSFVLILCLSFLATGCTMKISGKTFAYESITVEINTTGLTAEEKATLIEGLQEVVPTITADMTDAQLTEAYANSEAVKTYINNMLEDLKTETIVCGKNTITFYEDGVASEDKSFYKQDGKKILIYEDEALTKLVEEEGAGNITVKGKKLLMVQEMEKGVMATFTLKQVK